MCAVWAWKKSLLKKTRLKRPESIQEIFLDSFILKEGWCVLYKHENYTDCEYIHSPNWNWDFFFESIRLKLSWCALCEHEKKVLWRQLDWQDQNLIRRFFSTDSYLFMADVCCISTKITLIANIFTVRIWTEIFSSSQWDSN